MSFQSKVRICPICGRHLIITEMKENHRRYCYNCFPMGREGNYAAVKKVVEYCFVPDKLGENIIAVSVSELENPLDWEEIKEMLDNKEERMCL